MNRLRFSDVHTYQSSYWSVKAGLDANSSPMTPGQ